MNRLGFSPIFLACLNRAIAVEPGTAITDHTNYNVGSPVLVRLEPGIKAIASIRYAGKAQPIASNIPLSGAEYESLWTIPWNAQTGRYEVDLTMRDGKSIHGAESFAVHRQLAKVIAFDLDKTFYTGGDAVNPRIVVRNISNQRLDHLQVAIILQSPLVQTDSTGQRFIQITQIAIVAAPEPATPLLLGAALGALLIIKTNKPGAGRTYEEADDNQRQAARARLDR
jgi:hypothetical protein